MRLAHRLGFLALGTGVIALPAAAQRAAPSRTAAWVSLGAGRAVLPRGSDLAVHVEGSYQFGGSVVAVRTASASSILGALLNTITGSREDIEIHDYAVLLGRASRPAPWQVSAAAGVGLVAVNRDSAGTTSTSHYFTVPVEMQLAWRLLRHVGAVLCWFASFNRQHNFAGITVGVQIGRLR